MLFSDIHADSFDTYYKITLCPPGAELHDDRTGFFKGGSAYISC